MKKILVTLFFISDSALAQFARYYDDEFTGKTDEFWIWFAGFIVILFFIYGDKGVRITVAYFLALFGLPLIFGMVGKHFFGDFVGAIGFFSGLIIWYKLGKYLDR